MQKHNNKKKTSRGGLNHRSRWFSWFRYIFSFVSDLLCKFIHLTFHSFKITSENTTLSINAAVKLV